MKNLSREIKKLQKAIFRMHESTHEKVWYNEGKEEKCYAENMEVYCHQLTETLNKMKNCPCEYTQEYYEHEIKRFRQHPNWRAIDDKSYIEQYEIDVNRIGSFKDYINNRNEIDERVSHYSIETCLFNNRALEWWTSELDTNFIKKCGINPDRVSVFK